MIISFLTSTCYCLVLSPFICTIQSVSKIENVRYTKAGAIVTFRKPVEKNENEFDLLSYKYSIADTTNTNPEGGWKEGQLDGHVKITSKHTPSYLVKMIDHKPTFVWDMIIDDKSDISLLYFKLIVLSNGV